MIAQSDSVDGIAVALGAGVLVMPLVVIGLLVVSVRSRRRRLAEAAERLRQQGFSVVLGIPTAPSFPFEEFSKPRPKTGLHITQPGTYDSAFHYEYTIKINDQNKTYRLSCAVVPVPFLSPGVSIWRGSRSIIGRIAGNRVETDSERFNSAYEVACDDERFAYTMLSYEAVDWFLNEPAYSSGLTVRVNQNWMLLVRNRVEHEQLPGMLLMAQLLRDRFPAVLTSLYPLPT